MLSVSKLSIFTIPEVGLKLSLLSYLIMQDKHSIAVSPASVAMLLI